MASEETRGTTQRDLDKNNDKIPRSTLRRTERVGAVGRENESVGGFDSELAGSRVDEEPRAAAQGTKRTRVQQAGHPSASSDRGPVWAQQDDAPGTQEQKQLSDFQASGQRASRGGVW
eukprot:CAMPEP_0173377160 /NCGR_PEP_ID=MMETSP1356-20130122/358_1 /TAXON_ID=77927 ORGANISM="Hemiselmis virescens, Strain PCC157" /NCGR_SAMPLE_ID=MMETSP1356 /ASSEMBLY_ACC=CAM_ASM_000847 /LENGTH=117 /DNA_ID=CAMNT_0014329791 /DNA_START=287 /DNA_END=637 /DNA_ORIENTATION=-